VSLAASTQVLSEEDKKEEEQQALRKALFELRASTSDLEVESLGLTSAELQVCKYKYIDILPMYISIIYIPTHRNIYKHMCIYT
jgi:hypothetical protein